MSDLARPPAALPAQRENAERAVGTMVYGLYLAAPVTFGLSAVAGMLVANRRRDQAGPLAASHFRFQLWTFWATVFAAAAGGLWAFLGAAQATGAADNDGAWLALTGFVLCGAAAAGYLAATLYGLSRLVSRNPIARFFR